MDTVAPATRSRIMSRIRGRGNKTTEVKLRMALVRAGVAGWQTHPCDVAGHPDFYFPRERIAVFTDGCFWHGCLRCQKISKSRLEYWRPKIAKNVERDKIVNGQLKAQGVTVVRFWECELSECLTACVLEISATVDDNSPRRLPA